MANVRRCNITAQLLEGTPEEYIDVGGRMYKIVVEDDEQTGESYGTMGAIPIDSIEVMRRYLTRQNEIHDRPTKKSSIEILTED